MTPTTLTPTSFVVLGLVDGLGEATPYELKGAASVRLGDFWSLAHSQLYAEPDRLVGSGHLEVSRERTGRRRKHYRLTDRGEEAYAGWLADPDTDAYELRDPGLLKLALGADSVTLAQAQLAAHEEKLAAYEAAAEAIELPPTDGRVLALWAGIGHEREYVRFWSSLATRRP